MSCFCSDTNADLLSPMTEDCRHVPFDCWDSAAIGCQMDLNEVQKMQVLHGSFPNDMASFDPSFFLDFCTGGTFNVTSMTRVVAMHLRGFPRCRTHKRQNQRSKLWRACWHKNCRKRKLLIGFCKKQIVCARCHRICSFHSHWPNFFCFLFAMS